ncbi:tyrosine-type recombinase/integrase [Deinococcus radiophilus]|uniref:tyrosine-type recombinase/integrase n=1 Tax=Deinococcus radiophilus TaxID=32062 RepID=UPI001B863E98|nr:tyrosine-type recombinase/integrase [Deinococcus radiophilus]UFA52062.1 tyrosine-type recombinase/integrase [Deinococcus radiophilus]
MIDHITAFEHYLKLEEGRSPATIRNYAGDVRQLRAFLESDAYPLPQRGRDWAQVTAADLRLFLATLNPKPHRYHRLLASWRKFWAFLRDVQRLPLVGDPAAEIKRPKLPQRLPKYLESPDIAKLLQAAHDNPRPSVGLRNWAFLAFLYGTGARLSEVLGLTFDRITYSDTLPTAVTVIGKGDKERFVPLSPTAQRALMQWLQVRRVEGHPTSPYVWSYLSGANRGQPFGARNMQKMMDAAARKAGLDPAKVSPHKLRHSYATALVEHGRSLHEIGTILGHENPATTAIYGRVKAQQLAQAAASLPDVF